MTDVADAGDGADLSLLAPPEALADWRMVLAYEAVAGRPARTGLAPRRHARSSRHADPPLGRAPRSAAARPHRQGTAAVAEEGDDSIVVPVVNDALQQVQVALRHLGEEVPERDLTAVGDPGPRQQIRRLRDPGSGVEHDAPQVGVSTQDGSEQCPVPTADVDHGGEPGEVVGTGSTAAVPWVPWLIEALNSADSSGFCSR